MPPHSFHGRTSTRSAWSLGLQLPVALVAALVAGEESASAASLVFQEAWQSTAYVPSGISIGAVPSTLAQTPVVLTSLDPTDPLFVATGNNVSATLSFVDLGGNEVTLTGEVTRPVKVGNTIEGVVFFAPSDNGSGTTEAWILTIANHNGIAPAQQKIVPSTDVPTSQDPVEGDLNDSSRWSRPWSRSTTATSTTSSRPRTP